MTPTGVAASGFGGRPILTRLSTTSACAWLEPLTTDGVRGAPFVARVPSTEAADVSWQLGHVLAALFIALPDDRPVPTSLLVATAGLHLWVLGSALTPFVRMGRTPHDVVSGTYVARACLRSRTSDT